MLPRSRRKKLRTVTFYRMADGSKPVAEWLNTMDDNWAQAVAIGVRFFEEYPHPIVPKKLFEKITDDIWEIKVHCGKEQFRLFSFFEEGAVIIAAHGVAKKSMGLKKKDLELAEERRKDHLRRSAVLRISEPLHRTGKTRARSSTSSKSVRRGIREPGRSLRRSIRTMRSGCFWPNTG